jgi:hypothetical protein
MLYNDVRRETRWVRVRFESHVTVIEKWTLTGTLHLVRNNGLINEGGSVRDTPRRP